MSLSKLYGLFGVYGYRLLKTEVEDQVLYLHVEPQPHRVCCSACGGLTHLLLPSSFSILFPSSFGVPCSTFDIQFFRRE